MLVISYYINKRYSGNMRILPNPANVKREKKCIKNILNKYDYFCREMSIKSCTNTVARAGKRLYNVSGLSPEQTALYKKSNMILGVLDSKDPGLDRKIAFVDPIDKNRSLIAVLSRYPRQPATKISDETHDGQLTPQYLSKPVLLDRNISKDTQILTSTKTNVAGSKPMMGKDAKANLDRIAKKYATFDPKNPDLLNDAQDHFFNFGGNNNILP